MSVCVLITNYKRPANLPAVIAAWKRQSVPADAVIVVDNSPARDGQEVYPNPLFHEADDVWRFTKNLGCPCYFGPAFGLSEYDSLIHADDDFLPGTRAIETVLETSRSLDGDFATIGQFGRLFRSHGKRYINGNSPRGQVPFQSDLTCRVQFFDRWWLKHVQQFLFDLVYEFDEEAIRLAAIHDDLILCLGIQRGTHQPSYLIPESKDPERQLIKTSLPEPGAVWRRPEHFQERNRLIDMAAKIGWESRVGVHA